MHSRYCFKSSLSQKCCLATCLSFVKYSLGWWVPFSRVRTVLKAKLMSGNAHGYRPTLEQVTAPLWTSVSFRRRGTEIAPKDPSLAVLIFQDSTLN